MLGLIVTSLVCLVIYYVYDKLNYWKDKNVAYARTLNPFGTIWENVLQRKSIADIVNEWYNKFPTEPFFGIFTFCEPTLVIRDPDLIKELAVKESDVFIEHKLFSTDNQEHAFSQNLFSTKGHIWKAVRPALSPCFTGSRMRSMFILIKQCAQHAVDHYKAETEKKDIVEVNMKQDYMIRFTIDTTANCIFGFESNAFADWNGDIYWKMRTAGDFGGLKVFSIFGYCINRWIVKLFNMRVVDSANEDFFRNIVTDIVKMRKETGQIRPDMIHFLMEAQKGKAKHDLDNSLKNTGFATMDESSVDKEKTSMKITDKELIGHSLLFLIAGSDTPSCTMSFMMYEIAVNPDVQEKLYKEFVAANEKCKGDISYEELISLKYLDMVCSESLRKWPALPVTDRKTVRSYTINSNGKKVHLPIGSCIWIPIYSLHMDANNFEDPNKFDPERFNEKNKDKINKDTYMPFGVGPRGCIGSRMGMLLVKTIIFYTIMNFEVMPVKKTQIPAKLSGKYLFSNPDKPILLGFRKRC